MAATSDLNPAQRAVLAGAYEFRGELLSGTPYGSGHINDTYLLAVDQAGREVRYIAQRINRRVFRDPAGIMSNIARVTAHVAQKVHSRKDASRRVLTLVLTRDGCSFLKDEAGDYWRVYLFIEKARTYDVARDPAMAASAARAFGEFMSALRDFPADTLHEAIPRFHHTPSRYAALMQAVEEDRVGRAASVTREIDFFRAREEDAHRLVMLHEQGRIPLRVTHNDCKINNVMIDDETGEGICVIDLDTVMPGLSLYDFGDMVRTATSSAAEDERDLSRVHMRMEMFQSLVKGFLDGAGEFLTEAELEFLPFAGKLITMETAMRFLTDYLNGDTYFKIARPDHNLDRCRAQCRLVESIESQLGQMRRAVEELASARQSVQAV